MAISTINQAGLTAPLTLTSPVLTTPNLGTPSAINLSNATALPKTALPTGCIVQVVMGTATAGFSTTSTSYVATNLTATITPTSATSKILIFFTGPSYSLSVNYVYTTVYRNGATNLGFGGAAGLGITGNNPGTYDTSVTGMYLDSPATTSATTYTVYLKTSASSAYFGDNSGTGQVMILQEVVA